METRDLPTGVLDGVAESIMDGIPEIDLDWLSDWMRDNPTFGDSLLDLNGDSRDSTASEAEVLFGSLLTSIVNLHVPLDHINPNEAVRLEIVTPDVRVYSMDTMLGYLPHQLAPVMADVRDLARVDAIIPDAALFSETEVPLRLTLFGRSDNKNTCLAILHSRGFTLDSTELPDPHLSQPSNSFEMTEPFNQSRVPNLEHLFTADRVVPHNVMNIAPQIEPIDLTTREDHPEPSYLPAAELLESWNTHFAPSRPVPSVESYREQFTPDEMSSALDRLFETLDEDDKISMA